MPDSIKTSQMNFEEAFAELQTVIESLEAGEKPLEEALTLFKRGQALYLRCTELLDKAELQVQQLTESGELKDFVD